MLWLRCAPLSPQPPPLLALTATDYASQVSSFTDAALKYGRDRYLHGATGGGNGDGSGGGGSSDHAGLHVLESITNAAAPLHSATQADGSGCPVFREPKLSPLPGCPHRVCVCAVRSVCISYPVYDCVGRWDGWAVCGRYDGRPYDVLDLKGELQTFMIAVRVGVNWAAVCCAWCCLTSIIRATRQHQTRCVGYVCRYSCSRSAWSHVCAPSVQVLHTLATHPGIQACVQSEVDAVLGERADAGSLRLECVATVNRLCLRPGLQRELLSWHCQVPRPRSAARAGQGHHGGHAAAINSPLLRTHCERPHRDPR